VINFEKLKYKKFSGDKVKILLLTSKYFLIGEFITALEELNIKYEKIILGDTEYLTDEFIEILYKKISTFKPDFTFTINHLGVDREGVLMNFFEKIEMPLVSWYVDNPSLIIKQFKKNISDFCTILVWDKDNISDMKALGFKNVFYLPLGVDTHRFRYVDLNDNPFSQYKTEVMFVGNSMIEKVKKSLEKTNAPDFILKMHKKIGVDFSKSNERNVDDFIKKNYEQFYRLYEKLDEVNKTNFDTTVTWEATRIYRYQCVRKILPFKPLIVGDKGWKHYFRDKITYHPEVIYYSELPYFYNLADINFNTTSLQMKNAVNQRIFDVPACRRFLITDYREQIEDLFDIGEEIICYHDFEEITELTEKFLKHPEEREKVVKKAYRRVMETHRYTYRAEKLIDMARKIYG